MIENEIQSVCLPPSPNIIIEPPVFRLPELKGDNEHVSRSPELEDDDHVSREFPDYPLYSSNGRKSNFKYVKYVKTISRKSSSKKSKTKQLSLTRQVSGSHSTCFTSGFGLNGLTKEEWKLILEQGKPQQESVKLLPQYQVLFLLAVLLPVVKIMFMRPKSCLLPAISIFKNC